MRIKPAPALAAFLALSLPAAAGAQQKIEIAPSADYEFLVARLPSSDPPTWSVNGRRVEATTAPERFFLSADEGAVSAEGAAPAPGAAFLLEGGRWGKALRLSGDAMLSYPREGILDLDEGCVEFWLSPVEDGGSPSMAKSVWLFAYQAPGGDFLSVGVSDTGVIHGGAVVGGSWESAYDDRASIRGWKAGSWHHVQFVWSRKASSMRFFLDGYPAGDTNERHYWPPNGKGATFAIGSRLYRMDSVRIWDRALGAEAAKLFSRLQSPPGARESALATAGLTLGDTITCAAAGRSASFAYRGPPLASSVPHSGLLPAGSAELALSVTSVEPTVCRYSVGSPEPWSGMMDAGEKEPSLQHTILIKGLSADPAVTNDVYLRCESDPDFILHLRYRSIPSQSETFPKISNLWYDKSLGGDRSAYVSRLGLIVPSDTNPGPELLRAMHRENPRALIITTIQPFEYFEGAPPVPDSWYLKGTDGKRICMWPGSYRLNMTLPEVVEFNAQYIRRLLIDSDYLFDGAFFDSFSAEPWMERDSYGRKLAIDTDNDGREDDPAALRKAWRAGVLGIVERFKALEPNAVMTGHLGELASPDYGRYFHGDNIAFVAIDVIEGKQSFSYLKDRYDEWFSKGRLPGVSVIDVGAPNRLGYGYGVYGDWNAARAGIPAGVLDFARTWYPSMRFGLTVALLNDGYFERHFSDVLYCVDWWYDEFDADLGKALGPAYLALEPGEAAELLKGGDMGSAGLSPWSVWADESFGAEASIRGVQASPRPGRTAKALRVDIARPGKIGTKELHKINLFQENITVRSGATYELSFMARASGPRTMAVSLQRRAGDWESLGLWRSVELGTEWREIRCRFAATGTRSDAGLQFFLAGAREAVELAEVSLKEAAPDVWRRDFERGTSIVNGTSEARKVVLPSGYSRLEGGQAPRWQYIVDEDAKGVDFSGSWKKSSYETPAWKVDGPFYHSWGGACREASGARSSAQWPLGIPEDGTYAIKVWWTKAPSQGKWTKAATYEVVSKGKVIAAKAVDQSIGGDAWVEIARLPLSKSDEPALRLRNGGGGVLYADAVLVESEARYNDGSPAREVKLAPFDGIVLRKDAASR